MSSSGRRVDDEKCALCACDAIRKMRTRVVNSPERQKINFTDGRINLDRLPSIVYDS